MRKHITSSRQTWDTPSQTTTFSAKFDRRNTGWAFLWKPICRACGRYEVHHLTYGSSLTPITLDMSSLAEVSPSINRHFPLGRFLASVSGRIHEVGRSFPVMQNLHSPFSVLRDVGTKSGSLRRRREGLPSYVNCLLISLSRGETFSSPLSQTFIGR